MSTYLLINLLAVSIPLLFSFHPKIKFYQKWHAAWPAIIGPAVAFIAWDVLYTKWRVWGFNPIHISTIELLGLPPEEWLFFICIPYACLFTYHCMTAVFNFSKVFRRSIKKVNMIVITLLLFLGILYIQKAYTGVTFLLTAVLLLLLHQKEYLGRTYLSYLVLLVPFFVVNGLLTGTFVEQEVVWYDNTENLNFRLGTIPVEDVFYGFSLFLLNVAVYENTLKRKKRKLKNCFMRNSKTSSLKTGEIR